MSKTKLLSGLTALAVIALVTSPVDAGWRHRHGHRHGGGWGSSGGSSGGWGGSWGWGGSSGGGWGSGGGGWGHGSSGGGWGSSGGGWGSSGGGWSHGSSGGGWGSSGGYSYGGSSGGVTSGYIIDDGGAVEAPMAPSTGAPPAVENPGSPPPAPADDAGGAPGAGRGVFRTNRAAGVLAVRVPADAKVFVNGLETSSTGSYRQYASRNLKPGSSYNYEVRAEVVRNGEPVTETKTATISAGNSAELAFDFGGDAVELEPAETSLTVRLPAEAKLYLAGRETRAKGEVRQFTTTNLGNGGRWTSYQVRATLERDGETLVREETVTIEAGKQQELTVSFDEPTEQLARN